MLPVYVLRTPHSNRSKKLIDALTQIEGIDLRILESTMTSTYSEVSDRNIEVDYKYASFFIGREMLPQEIGCSHTHNTARKLLSETDIGGVILEDDAEITELKNFAEICTFFLLSNKKKKAVLSLYNPESRTVSTQNVNSDYIALFGTPKLAVGYVITPTASENLLLNNVPIRYVADWPISNSKYFMVKQSLVNHTDNYSSTITPENQDLRDFRYSRISYIFDLIRKFEFSLNDLCIVLDIIPKVLNNHFRFKIDRFLN